MPCVDVDSLCDCLPNLRGGAVAIDQSSAHAMLDEVVYKSVDGLDIYYDLHYDPEALDLPVIVWFRTFSLPALALPTATLSRDCR